MKYLITLICWILGSVCLYYYFETGGTWEDLFVDFCYIVAAIAEGMAEAQN